ncbi:hypothetical protein OGH69_04000 [Flavobacterium sp. MFBS3-15]|uniref:hypothetical protein n=1 Tax=Flavobacterium sp. MFBS3-15 TaxID=2989816 RepID=UPI00223633C9|nr:hypothetical protein [Flavobacterium sp. MFBS3-15]MCW4468118.1 hypothetical protein [Flavobacterium sp. MFBS3-15]
MDATKQELMRTIGEAYSPYLEAGKVYHVDVTKGTYGGQQSGIYYTKDGKKYSPYSNLPPQERKALDEELRKLNNATDELRSTIDLGDLYDDLPGNTQVRFTFIKDEPVAMQVYGVADLIGMLEERILEKAEGVTDQGAFKKAEGMGEFTEQADKVSIAGSYSIAFENKIFSLSSFYGMGLDLLNVALGNQLQRIWFRLENDVLTVQTEPAFPEHGLHGIENNAIALDPEYAKRKEAIAEAIRLRHDFFRSAGTLHDEILYLNLGGFRDHNWPGYTTGTIAAKFRVIYTENTTIVITDGLSDIYANERDDKELAHNGIGAEFYVEFDSIVPFYKVRDHYMMALLNSVTQIALRHGQFRALIEKFESLTLQFNTSDVETWVIRDNDSNNEAGTFFNSSQYDANAPFGALLTMASKSLPKRIKLNIEEVALVCVKPFGKEWFGSDRLSHPDEEVKTAARMAMIKGFEEDGSYNTIPVLYK